MTKTQLASMYGVCVETFTKWIKPFQTEIGKMSGRYTYTPAQVKIIFEKIGQP